MERVANSVVKIETGGQHFDIPLGHFYWDYVKYGRQWPTAKTKRSHVEQISLIFLLPDLAPYSPKNAAGFESLGVGDKVNVLLGKTRNPNWLPTYLRNVGYRLKKSEQELAEAPNLIHYLDTITQADFFLMPNELQKPYFNIYCNTGSKGEKKIMQRQNRFLNKPYCRV